MNAIEQRRRMRGQGGFTLIELLVVIAILAILAGVVVFAVSGINNTSQETACKTEAQTVKTAVQAFYAQENKYPASANDTTSPPSSKAFIPGFLESQPKNVDIVYASLGTPGSEYTWHSGGKCASLATAGKLSSTP